MAMMNDGDQDEFALNNEINMTPFIDVMLVLLIIFMVAAPLSTVSVPLELPGADAQAQTLEQNQLILSLDKELQLFLGDQAVSKDGLEAALNMASHNNPEQIVFIRADEKVDYGNVISVLNTLRSIGYLNVSLIGEEDLN
ncbi:biopolymer transporter ExbD [Pseudoalteromonas luteoviolacea]|uniref:biopolymer transporter ExbD n=1 Tax=Pseudoalteromonas luteoviolacea TaxID=43657 RepID=UPI001F1AC130|nr:biopolymer transporter ExbD [Pseudoalteromonas luteoviolacea]MCF6440903.1 biopolymer transporter ExbD [Pseudoalteromonas luteoviolacea]